MAYQSKNLSALAYANGFTLWHYRTEDNIGSGPDVGYFDGASRMVRVGDFIFVNDVFAGMARGCVLIVVANSGGKVTMASVAMQTSFPGS